MSMEERPPGRDAELAEHLAKLIVDCPTIELAGYIGSHA